MWHHFFPSRRQKCLFPWISLRILKSLMKLHLAINVKERNGSIVSSWIERIESPMENQGTSILPNSSHRCSDKVPPLIRTSPHINLTSFLSKGASWLKRTVSQPLHYKLLNMWSCSGKTWIFPQTQRSEQTDRKSNNWGGKYSTFKVADRGTQDNLIHWVCVYGILHMARTKL